MIFFPIATQRDNSPKSYSFFQNTQVLRPNKKQREDNQRLC